MLPLAGQESPERKNQDYPYNRKEEINHDDKRYRVYNNYVTIGGGLGISTIRNSYQQVAGADFHFHIKRQYFNGGVMLSGFQFFANNHMQAHMGYEFRRESHDRNFAVSLGPSIYQGVEGVVGTPEQFYSGMGLYAGLQAVHKITYDIGAGIELFADVGIQNRWGGRDQVLYGAKVIVFFSGAYRGPKRKYNPNIRAENPNG